MLVSICAYQKRDFVIHHYHSQLLIQLLVRYLCTPTHLHTNNGINTCTLASSRTLHLCACVRPVVQLAMTLWVHALNSRDTLAVSQCFHSEPSYLFLSPPARIELYRFHHSSRSSVNLLSPLPPPRVWDGSGWSIVQMGTKKNIIWRNLFSRATRRLLTHFVTIIFSSGNKFFIWLFFNVDFGTFITRRMTFPITFIIKKHHS